MSAARNHEWQDSLIDWAEHQDFERDRLAFLNADYTKRERQYVEMQGRPAWPARRCSPEVQPVPAEAATEIGAEDQSESADGVFWIYMATIGAVIAAAVWAVWA